jgi:hypothetical protein
MAVRVKKFDAIKMSRRVRAVTSGKLNAMTRKEQLAYLRKAAERHRKEIRARTDVQIMTKSK